MLKFFLLLSLVNISVFAEVSLLEKADRSIRVSHPRRMPWKMDEEVCVVRYEEVVGCGKVVDRSPQFADIDTGDFTEEIQPGDRIQSYVEIQDKMKRFQITPGVEAGLGFVFTTLDFQVRVYEQWFVGLMGSYSSSEDSGYQISQKGFLLSANHYSLLNPFPGFWFRIGGGAYILDVTRNQTETTTVPFALTTVGWRTQFLTYFTTGLGVGVQYLPNRIQSTKLGLREFEGLATFDIGVKW